MKSYFGFDRHATNYRREIIGGVTTFFAMAYIIVVNPAILSTGGLPKEAGTTATILAAIVGTLVMALYARRPFAVAPYMVENAFIAYTVCLSMGLSWQLALGGVFISGVIFIIITLLRVRAWISTAIPLALKYSFAAGFGLFIIFIGLNTAHLVVLGVPGAPVTIGDLASLPAALALGCLLLIIVLMIWRVPGALLIGMLVTTVVSLALGNGTWPGAIVAPPPSLEPVWLKLDIAGALSWQMLPIILVLFIMAFVDTMGTLIGLSARAGLLDEHHNLPEIEKPMMADAIATTAAGLLGTSTTGAYIESAAGIEAGARTGFASVITALMFALCLFLSPVFLTVPPEAYGATLIAVGAVMIRPFKDIPFDDYTELFPAVGTITVMLFTFNIGFGIASGFLLYPLLKLAAGRPREIKPAVWILFAISLLLFIVYPYH